MKNLLLLFCLSIPCFAQSTVEKLTVEETNLLGQLSAIEMDAGGRCLSLPATCKDTSQELAAVYAQIAKYPRLVRSIAADAAFRYARISNQTQSAMQASQVADQQNAKLIPLLIIQNQRIIELLEVIAKKPR